jgi:protocatechuate 3,4-dioxygenase beta subunit
MHMTGSFYGRRRFLRGLTLGMAAFTARGVFAQQLAETASTGEGPFYPDKLPLDADNDLLIINDAITPGVGAITHLTGRVLTATGHPVRNAFVEIWQADNTGSYVHSAAFGATSRDSTTFVPSSRSITP